MVNAVSTTFEVAKAQITVKADDVSTEYGEAQYGTAGKPFPFTASGLVNGETQEDLVASGALTVTLRVDETVKDAKVYTIKGTGSATNYTFTVEDGKYTVTKREVTLTITDQEKVYDGTVPTVSDSAWTAPDGAIVGSDNLFVKLTVKDAASAAGVYAITGTWTNENYAVTFAGSYQKDGSEFRDHAGTYTVKRRAVTVEIQDQSATYDYDKAQTKSYSFNASGWSVVVGEGDGLASGEVATVLGVALSVGELKDGKYSVCALKDAGKYLIMGSATNTNYNVTFTGSYESEDEYSGEAGVYTIAKLDVSDFGVIFMLRVGEDGDEGMTEGLRTVRVKYAGEPLPLACSAMLSMGSETFNFETSLDRTVIDAAGNYTIVVTIEDVNYSGKTEFLVIVTDADGYTQRLKDVLAQLKTLAEGLDKEQLQAEDYPTLLKMYTFLKSLDDAEREVGATALAEYEAYITAWDENADIGEVVETAQTLADAPIASLFEAAAALTALVGLAYIAMKGGML